MSTFQRIATRCAGRIEVRGNDTGTLVRGNRELARERTSTNDFLLVWRSPPVAAYMGGEIFDALPVHCVQVQEARVLKRCTFTSNYLRQLPRVKYSCGS